ncbi:16S rRNA (cytosine(1402)-N(4))-methyltransferase [Candidatus Roizmanbacteria bacterium CG09_land_8_20_14_0_10_41_9]|uniref:Ribosomal RNA small subunit methyltransferase H n=1 Tax=Candidatus Roizmanbacteria bacterium CG09_land_8_20_14_0_10_41_9 TaxID=1974850 RepID=A0A2H0WSG2_9BACT|nr:MAG: 16S rRNA (cytosine(1402)-N(4))-methyltransferase [Candidatus Roizmanbacteria bacterium CG09_land_8_20_14_0_10_41_9]
MHTPVLLQQAIEGLRLNSQGFYIDATVGEGGHVSEMLKKQTRILAIDADSEQVKRLKNRFGHDKNLILEVGNFSEIEHIAKKQGFFPVDGVLFDLGLSMRQLKEGHRGFSYKELDDPLDMRIDANTLLTAEEILSQKSEKELSEIFSKNAEEIFSERIAHAIATARRKKGITTVGELVSIVQSAHKGINRSTVARIFQALRIEVNDEITNLKKGLQGALSIIKKPGGRIVVISFHSLEDRVVKLFARQHHMNMSTMKPKTKGAKAGFERSATLRIISC